MDNKYGRKVNFQIVYDFRDSQGLGFILYTLNLALKSY